MKCRRVKWAEKSPPDFQRSEGRIQVRREDGRYRRPPWWANKDLQMLLALVATLLFVRLIYVLVTQISG